jgi:hypothetical protein
MFSLCLAGGGSDLVVYPMDPSLHFNLGLRALENSLFNIRIRKGLQARLMVNLTYCTLGAEDSFHLGSDDSVVAVSSLLFDLPLYPEYESSEVIISNEAGHGTSRLSRDGSCFRLYVRSSLINQSISFAAVFVSLRQVSNSSSSAFQNLSSPFDLTTTRYYPTLGNMFVEYTSSTDDKMFSDPGGLINMSDILPPVYSGCPAEDIVVFAQGLNEIIPDFDALPSLFFFFFLSSFLERYTARSCTFL